MKRHYQKFEALESMLGRFAMGDISANHRAEVEGFHGWNYIAITAAAKQAARTLVRVYDDQRHPENRDIRKSLRAQHGPDWLKSYSREHEGDIQPREHKLVQLLNRPNKFQTGSSFRWEQVQQLRIHGSCIVFNRPNVSRTRVVERYVIPIALVNPISPGMYEGMPNGGVEVNPSQYLHGAMYSTAEGFAPILQLGPIRVPVEMLSICRYPHPYLRSDGASPTSAISKWIDTSNLVADLRLKYYGKGANGQVIVNADTDDPSKIDEAQRRLEKVLGPDGPGVVVLGKSQSIAQQRTAEDMGFDESDGTMKTGILAAHHVSRTMIGDQDSMTYGSLAASMLGSAIMSVQPDMDLIADEDTIDLAGQYEGLLSVEYEVPTIKDVQLEESRLATDSQLYVMTVGQYRKLRGWEPFGDERDELMIGAQGLMSKEQILSGTGGKQKPGQDQVGAGMPGMAAQQSNPGMNWWSYRSPMVKSAMAMTTMDFPLISVEFNGTIVDPFDPSDKKPKRLGKNAQKALSLLKAAGARVSVFTDSDPNEVRDFLTVNGIEFDDINCPESPEVIWDRVASGAVAVDRLVDLQDMAIPEARVAFALQELLKAELSCQADQEPVRKYGCVMLSMPSSVATRIKSLAATIDPAHLAVGGVEDEPHVTVLYGLVGCETAEVAETVKRMGSASLVLGNLSCFPEGEYGVPLKIEVDSPQLVAMNEKLRQTFPHVMTFPVYIPHVTVAYIKPEFVELYTGPCQLSGSMVDCTQAIISTPGKAKCYIPLRVGDPAQSPLAMTISNDDRSMELAEMFAGRMNSLKSLRNGSQSRYREIVRASQTALRKPRRRRSKTDKAISALQKSISDLAEIVSKSVAPKVGQPSILPPPSNTAAIDPDDSQAKAEEIADILFAVFGPGAEQLFDSVYGSDVHKFYREIDHPRGAGGRWIKKNTPEAYAAAKNRVRQILGSARGPDALRTLVEHLSMLTIDQLKKLKTEFGIKAAFRNKAGLAEKLADRLYRGRWGDSQESETAARQEQAENPPITPSDLDLAIEREKKIYTLRDHEEVYAYLGGREVFGNPNGNEDSALVEVKMLRTKYPRSIITHNHPGGWKENHRGRSFSIEDIAVALASDASEIRAVAKVYVHSLKIPEGWSDKWYENMIAGYRENGDTVSVKKAEKLATEQTKGVAVFDGLIWNSYQRIRDDIRGRHQAKIFSLTGAEQAAYLNFATEQTQHQIMESLASLYGLEYTRQAHGHS